ncbi:GIY-YIG nuclease family protein [Methylocaldum sp.]|uniref:GIY-YIG nuclease family protein n=1 Tax=Methylocaldum sp. TaxID=1969727 RepID=UPI002D719F7F|nr:GIY-YIG nuclease family protein [Methylocaldum sp.]HYE36468.1 GIY-YIG nuclease family protein [Methylocaldum sp.]
MTKERILKEISRLAIENGGVAPGSAKFATETGIRKSDWYPNLWLRWSDAVSEAGFAPNKFTTAYNSEILILKYIELIRELGHFPIEGELANKRKVDSSFPDRGAFSQLGTKQDRVKRIFEYCRNRSDCADIVEHCKDAARSRNRSTVVEKSGAESVGYVYLLRHGTRNEYKIGRTNNPIRREGEIRFELPEKVQPIHYIKTDDPAGVEIYWHSRFSTKRKAGEWFALNADDVRAFKRWRKIF